MKNPELGRWLAIGIAIGTGLGVASHNIPVGVAAGVGLGLLIGVIRGRRGKNTPPQAP